MAIIVKPYTFIPGTVIRSSEVNLDFDTIYSDYNGNIDNTNIAAAAGILYSKLVPMSGDATITGGGVITVTGLSPASSTTFTNLTLSGALTLSSMTPGSVLFAGPAGLVSQDNASFFWDDTNNRLGIGSPGAAYNIDVNRSAVGAANVPTIAARNSNNASALSHAILHAQTGGAAGGDPYLMFNVNGAGFWSIGIDNSDNDNLHFSTINGLSGADPFIMRSNGEFLVPAVNPPTPNYANRNSFVKAWGYINQNVPSIIAGYNIASVAFLGPAGTRITWSTPFSSANYILVSGSTTAGEVTFVNQTPTTVDVICYNSAGGGPVLTLFYFMAIGDQ